MSKINAGLMASERMDWNTPADVLEFVRRFAPIALDPCSNAGSIVDAAQEWIFDRDGDSLAKDWIADGLIYVNSPYGREIIDWIRKCAIQAEENQAEIIALVPARTDTAWWRIASEADGICFVRGRLKFLGAPSNAPFPSALIYWGDRFKRFERVMEDLGWVVRP